MKNEGLITKALVSMVSNEAIAQVDEEISRKKIRADVATDLATFATAAQTNLLRDIADNHGIKSNNQKRLLLAIGIDPEIVDLPTSAALDAFGTKRGDFAHKAKIATTETRNSVTSDVKTMLSGLKTFDLEANEVLKARMAS